MSQAMAFPTGLPTNKLDVAFFYASDSMVTPQLYLQYSLPWLNPPIYFGSAPDLGAISYNYSTAVWEFYAYVIPGGWIKTPLRVDDLTTTGKVTAGSAGNEAVKSNGNIVLKAGQKLIFDGD